MFELYRVDPASVHHSTLFLQNIHAAAREAAAAYRDGHDVGNQIEDISAALQALSKPSTGMRRNGIAGANRVKVGIALDSIADEVLKALKLQTRPGLFPETFSAIREHISYAARTARRLSPHDAYSEVPVLPLEPVFRRCYKIRH